MTNLSMINKYVQNLCRYVKLYFKEELMRNLNTPFGFPPSKRLKLIHGYDSFVE